MDVAAFNPSELLKRDPVFTGLVSSYARPGGNIIGLAVSGGDLSRKRAELLKEALPAISRVAVLLNPRLPSASVLWWREAEVAAQALGITLERVEVQAPGEIEAAYAAIDKGRFDALLVFSDPLIFEERKRRADLAASSRLPVMNSIRMPAELGDLMSYAPNYPNLYVGAAVYVDKTLRGAKPTDLPVEEPTRFDFVIQSQDSEGAQPRDFSAADRPCHRRDRIASGCRLLADTVTKLFWAAARATLIRRRASHRKEDSKRCPRWSENFAANPSGRLLQHDRHF
ncbi:MAG TPA: ABC transporter substrate-binding protein [Stellaceae bacterium]|nr:ABC transporter substrate-binding protein [Stellaceae bacterium]